MRTLLIASVAVAAMTAGDASAQRMVAHGPGADYPAPGMTQTYATPGRPTVQARGGRWGSNVDGHWWGGMNAPGGWNGYRRPHRGSQLSPYWVSPRFAIGDWQDYGLSEPPYGYSWSRYYDDAVLIDGRGGVYDTMGGVDWDGYAGNDAVYAGNAGYAQPGYAPGAGHPPPPPPPAYGYDQHRSNGIGGAVAGAAVGGVAGNLIAGRGNRLAGTLIGAGVGGAAGYAIDRGSHRGPRYGAGYGEPPVAPGYAPPPPPPPPRPAGWVSPDGGTVVTTTTSGGYGGSTTTVVVQTAPVVTTTTTEIYEDAVTYSPRHRVWHRKVWHKPVWHRPACGCR